MYSKSQEVGTWNSDYLPSRKPTWNLQRGSPETTVFFRGALFRFCVGFPESTLTVLLCFGGGVHRNLQLSGSYS